MSQDLPPGRELDALIAEKVMGRKREWRGRGWPSPNETLELEWMWVGSGQGMEQKTSPYSTDIAAAWEIVDEIGPVWRGFQFIIQWTEHSWREQCWEAGWYESGNEGPEGRATAVAATVPHAISLAALKVIELRNP
jgi:hypothetical protein